MNENLLQKLLDNIRKGITNHFTTELKDKMKEYYFNAIEENERKLKEVLAEGYRKHFIRNLD